MNLNEYDSIKEKIDKNKTWVNVRKKQLLSRELANRPYNCLMKRYNQSTGSTSYFIAMLDKPPTDRKYKNTVRDDYGRIKISIANIWTETYLVRLEEDCNMMVSLVEHGEDGDIYLLDV